MDIMDVRTDRDSKNDKIDKCTNGRKDRQG